MNANPESSPSGVLQEALGPQSVDLQALLDRAVEAQTPEPAGQKWPSGAARGVQKLSYTHDAMVDLIIANPAISQGQLAAHFGYTPGWISQVIASGTFQERLAERTKDLVDPTIRATVEDRFKALVLRSLDILREKLDNPSHQIPDNLALRSLELSSRALGYGAREQAPLAPAVSVSVHLENLGGNLVQLLRKKKLEASSDAEFEPTSGGSDVSQVQG